MEILKHRKTALLGMFVGLGLLTYWLTGPARSQTVNPDTELQACIALLSDSFYDEALPRLANLSRLFPMTQYDLQARTNEAYVYGAACNNPSKAYTIDQSIISDFPTSPERFVAQMNLADIDFIDNGGTLPAYLANLDAIIAVAGGNSLEEVIAGRTSLQLSTPSVDITSQLQTEALANVYSLASSRLSNLPASSQTITAFQQAKAIKLFMVNNFAASMTDDAFENLHLVSLQAAGLSAVNETVPPRITEVFPDDEDRVGPLVSIKARMNDGDIQQSQVNPSTLVVSLDGQSLSNLAVKHKLNTRSDRAIYDRVTVESAPVTLDEGRHVVTVSVWDYAGNKANRTVNFEVRRGRPEEPPHWDS